MNADEPGFSLASLDTQRALCRGLDLLYGVRAHTPTLRGYWLLPEALSGQESLEAIQLETNVPVGMLHHKRADPLADYSLYVPESYTPRQDWPLIICLHGAYGRGDHYVWSWLRAAKSKGYMLLAAKSVDVTWSIMQPVRDVNSVTAMFDEVCQEYAVDKGRVFLSGLSDGGTFTYL